MLGRSMIQACRSPTLGDLLAMVLSLGPTTGTQRVALGITTVRPHPKAEGLLWVGLQP